MDLSLPSVSLPVCTILRIYPFGYQDIPSKTGYNDKWGRCHLDERWAGINEKQIETGEITETWAVCDMVA
jgi:hypothetical protein